MNGVQDGKKEKGGNGDLAGSQLFSQIERWVKKEGKNKKQKNLTQKTKTQKHKHSPQAEQTPSCSHLELLAFAFT